MQIIVLILKGKEFEKFITYLALYLESPIKSKTSIFSDKKISDVANWYQSFWWTENDRLGR